MIEVHERMSCRSLVVQVAARGVMRPLLGFFPVRGPVAPVRHLVEIGARAVPRLPGIECERIEGDGWHAELVRTSGSAKGRAALVYFHGGAFLVGGVATHRRIVERLAQRTGLPVLSVGYRQMSKHTVATSVTDCVEAVNWLIRQGYEPDQLVLAGDSAGGHLSFAVALAATEQGIDLGGIVALSPWLEFDNAERRRHGNAWRDPFIPTFRLDRVARQVTGSKILDPLHSPVNRELAELPPALIMCAADEVLRYDAELMTERLEVAGVPVGLHIWKGQVHAFPVMGHLLPESRAALDLISDFVADVLGVRHLRPVAGLATA